MRKSNKDPRTDLIDLTGKVFGKWTVLEYSHYEKRTTRWLCLCSCGNKTTVIGRALRTGRSSSCGHCGREGRLPEGEQAKNSLYGTYVLGAKNRGLTFEFTMECFSKITKENCKYCGTPPSQVYTRRGHNGEISSVYVYNGVDRVNNGRGYVEENCVPCCKTCNLAKHAMTLEEFLAWLDRVVKFRTQPESPIIDGGEKQIKCPSIN